MKVVIFGKASVGKASFVNRNTKGNSSDERRDGCNEIVFKSLFIRNTNITFQIVVCNCKFSSSNNLIFIFVYFTEKLNFFLQLVNSDMFLNDSELMDASGVFLMYDITNRDTFLAIESMYLLIFLYFCN